MAVAPVHPAIGLMLAGDGSPLPACAASMLTTQLFSGKSSLPGKPRAGLYRMAATSPVTSSMSWMWFSMASSRVLWDTMALASTVTSSSPVLETVSRAYRV